MKDGEELVIDRHVFCARHPDKHVELHCKQCQMLICILCRGTDHHFHEAETIQDALNYIVPIVQQNTERIEKRIKENQEVKDTMNASLTDLDKTYKKIEKEIDDKHGEIMRKIDTERKLLKEQLSVAQEKQASEIKKGIDALDLRWKSEKNMLALSNATLTTAQGTSLLRALQGGVSDSLVTYLATEPDFPKFESGSQVQFQPSAVLQDHLLGSISEVDQASGCQTSMWIEQPLSEIGQKNIKEIKRSETGFTCNRLAAINEKLWCVECNTNKIHVFSLDGTKQKTIELSNNIKCRAAIQARSNVVVAAAYGVYLTDTNGQNSRVVVNGDFCDVSFNSDTLFGLNDRNSKVCILKYNKGTDSYVTIREFVIDNYTKSNYNTIQATCEHIYIAQHGAHNILQYGHDGTLVAAHGSRRTVVGQLRYPWLSGVDTRGTLLIADQSNQRLLTLTKHGDFQCLTKVNLNYLYCAVVVENMIYMVGLNRDYHLVQYSLK